MKNIVKPKLTDATKNFKIKTYSYNQDKPKNTKIKFSTFDESFADFFKETKKEFKENLVTPKLEDNFKEGKIESFFQQFHIFDDVDETTESQNPTPESSKEDVQPVTPASETPKEEAQPVTPEPSKEEKQPETPAPAPSKEEKQPETPAPKPPKEEKQPKEEDKPKPDKTNYSDIPAAKTSNMDPNGELPGSTNDEKIWIYCKSKGYTDAQAAAVVGNAQVESWDWNYSLRDSDNGLYYGLFMNSHQYAGSYNNKSAKQQLDLMNGEIESRMKYWNGRGYDTSYSSWQSYSGANDVDAATSCFMYGYEGTMRNQMLSQRQKYAQAAYQKFAGKY